MIPFHRAMREKQLSLGLIHLWKTPELFPIYSRAGFNHVMLDHMFTACDWGATADLIMGARTAGLAPLLRVQTFPWAGGTPDMNVVSQVARARALGAAGAIVSISSVEQVEALMRVANDVAHHPGVGGPQAAAAYFDGGWEAVEALVREDVREFPIVAYFEGADLVEMVEDVVAIDGLKAVGLGLHDVCHSLDRHFEVDHPDVWAVVERVVAAARPRGINVMTNTGYIYDRPDQIVPRIERLYSHGVDIIQTQTPGQLFYPVLSDIARAAYEVVAPAAVAASDAATALGPRAGLD